MKEKSKKVVAGGNTKLREFLKQENIEENHVEMVVCEGTPSLKINQKALEKKRLFSTQLKN